MTIPGYESYFGGKGSMGAHQFIINHIPPHEVFISACLGLCYVLRKIYPAQETIGIEINPKVYQAWCEAEKDRKLTLINDNSHDWLYAHEWDHFRRQFLYVDPPYLMDARKSSRKVYFKEWTPMEHELYLKRLLWLDTLYPSVLIMVQHYPHPLHDELLLRNGWHHADYEANTRQGIAKERIYMNYPTPDELHDYRYVGKDYREREVITKLKQKWTGQFQRMIPAEREAIFEAMEGFDWDSEVSGSKGYLALLQKKDPRVRKGIIQHLQLTFGREKLAGVPTK